MSFAETSHVKRGLGNLIMRGIDQLVAVGKNRLKPIQCRPELIDAFSLIPD